MLTTVTRGQGELAHRLVKQLYGKTNKRNTSMQIGKRVRRLERAQDAADRQRIKTRTEMPDVNIESDECMAMNLDARYEVPNLRTDPVDLYSFVREHRGDPAIKVRLQSSI